MSEDYATVFVMNMLYNKLLLHYIVAVVTLTVDLWILYRNFTVTCLD